MTRIIQNKKVLVTGGAGFIGSNLCEVLLDQGNEVICLDNMDTGKPENISNFIKNDYFTFIQGDIRDLNTCIDAMRGVDHVLHQAALGNVPRSIDDPILTNNVNITGFLNILQAARETGIKRVVYAASSSTYGDSPLSPKKEDEIGMPLSPYAVTKYVNELYAHVFSNLFGLETIGLRYFNVFGRRQSPDGAYAAAIPKFMQALISKKSPVIHGDGEQTRDFTYIDNVIQANQLAALTTNPEAINKVYNVACGEKVTVINLVETLRTELSKIDAEIANVEIEFGPERLGDVKHSMADIGRIQKLLAYEPTHNLSEGIKEAINWYWNNLK